MTKSHLICIDRQTWWSWQHFILNQTFTKLGQQLGLVWHHILVRWSYTKIRTNTSRLRQRPKIWPKTKRPRACKHRAAHSRPVWYYMGGAKKGPSPLRRAGPTHLWLQNQLVWASSYHGWKSLMIFTPDYVWAQTILAHLIPQESSWHAPAPVGWPNQLAWASSS